MLNFIYGLFLGVSGKDEKNDEDPRIQQREEDLKIINPLVDRMLKIEELFILSLSTENALHTFLQKNKDCYDKMTNISRQIQADMNLSEFKDEMKVFTIALLAMKQTKGFSMQEYLLEDKNFVQTLANQMEDLESIYAMFKADESRIKNGSHKRKLSQVEDLDTRDTSTLLLQQRKKPKRDNKKQQEEKKSSIVLSCASMQTLRFR